MLRDYQQRAIRQLYDWLRGHDGNPCLVLPTGSGKSHIIAALCKDALQSWPETRILILAHVRELLAQNAEKIRQHWPNAPMGIYSAGLRSRVIDEPITVAGIQSVRNRADDIGHIDLCLIDEAHLIAHNADGGYRTLIAGLLEINPSMRVVGLTATPYRLGHGLITDRPALFDALLEPVSIDELVGHGYLAPLRSKLTVARVSADGVGRRGGEYIARDLEQAVNTDAINAPAVAEIIERGQEYRSWIIFCAGVAHAQTIAEMLRAAGIVAECVTGETPAAERDRILRLYKSGEIRALTNASVLTTGFDAPDTDLIAFLRPTLSPGLYVQMAGRGMRLKRHTDHCLVLDFAGNVARHGPITAVAIPTKSGKAEGPAPARACPECGEILATATRICPSCGYEWPQAEKPLVLETQQDIMGGAVEMAVTEWAWRKHTSRSSGKDMIRIVYYESPFSAPVTEYLPVTHPGRVGERAMARLAMLARNAGRHIGDIPTTYTDWLEEICIVMSNAPPPRRIEYKRDGQFARVTAHYFEEHSAADRGSAVAA